ncbi:MAG: hypothetical protein Q4P28_00045 [Tissierellia bacterium]|nr:hypothetical protein [Tissierellia bacterium]
MSIAIVLFSMVLIGRRYLQKGHEIHTFRTKFMEDRIMEFVFIQTLLVLIIIDYFAKRNYKLDIFIFIIYILIVFLEYRKTKVGIYENGIIFKSQFYRWNNIYTFRSYTLTNGDIKFVFYIHQYLQRKQLNKWAVILSPDRGIPLERELDQKLDRRRN